MTRPGVRFDGFLTVVRARLPWILCLFPCRRSLVLLVLGLWSLLSPFSDFRQFVFRTYRMFFRGGNELMQGFNLTRSFGARVLFAIRMSVLFKSVINGFVIGRYMHSICTNINLFRVCSRNVLISKRSRDRNNGFTICVRSTSNRSRFFGVIRNMSRYTAFITHSFVLITVINLAPFNFRIRAFLSTIKDSKDVFMVVNTFRFISVVPFKLRFLSNGHNRIYARVRMVNVIPIYYRLRFSKRRNFRFQTRTQACSRRTREFPFPIYIFSRYIRCFYRVSIACQRRMRRFIIYPRFRRRRTIRSNGLYVM